MAFAILLQHLEVNMRARSEIIERTSAAASYSASASYSAYASTSAYASKLMASRQSDPRIASLRASASASAYPSISASASKRASKVRRAVSSSISRSIRSSSSAAASRTASFSARISRSSSGSTSAAASRSASASSSTSYMYSHLYKPGMLKFAAEEGNVARLAEVLMAQHGGLDAVFDGTTLLQLYCMSGNVDAASILLGLGASVDFFPAPFAVPLVPGSPSIVAVSPLFIAAVINNVQLARMLLERGAHASGKVGFLALNAALHNPKGEPREEMVALLREWGAHEDDWMY